MSKKKLRQNEILNCLGLKEDVSVEELSEKYGMTEATIRRDLEELEQEGRLIRTHGGARIISDDPITAKNFKERRKTMLKEKEAIINKVAGMIPDGAVITLDNGTTSWLLAKNLKHKNNLTVITNSIQVLEELYDAQGIKLMMTGGTFRERNMDFIGVKAVDFLRDIYSDIAILTCDSVRPGFGFYKLSELSAEIAKAMVAHAKKIYVISDHSKVDANGPYRILSPNEVDIFFTDSNIPQADREKLNNEAYKTIYC